MRMQDLCRGSPGHTQASHVVLCWEHVPRPALTQGGVQAMLAMDDTGALLRFVQRPNRVSLREGEAALKAAGRYSELVALYQERGQHSAALDLLRTLSLVRRETFLHCSLHPEL